MGAHTDTADFYFEKFTKEHTPPAHVQEFIDRNKEKILSGDFFLRAEDGSIVALSKGRDVSRIFNANDVGEVIKKNEFNSLEVPQKWVKQVDGEWRVFAEYISGKKLSPEKPLTLEETQELVSFVEKTGLSDFGFGYGDNILRNNETGKLALIDLEDNSFSAGASKRALVSKLFDKFGYAMDPKAVEWVQSYYDNLPNQERAEYLPVSGKEKRYYYQFVEQNPGKEDEYLEKNYEAMIERRWTQHNRANRKRKQ